MLAPIKKADLANIPQFNISPLDSPDLTIHGRVRPGHLWQYILVEVDKTFYLMPYENVPEQLGKRKAAEIPILYNLW